MELTKRYVRAIVAVMRWQRSITLGGLVVAVAALAAWQWHEYGLARTLARDMVSGSADSIMNALVGGVQSHRRLGQYFSENIQGVLDGLVQSQDVQAVAVVSEDGESVLAAGDVALLDLTPPVEAGEYWDATGFRLVNQFQLPLESGGYGAGGGGGRGRGRRGQMEAEPEEAIGSFAPGATVAAVLLVDRSRADRVRHGAAWLRIAIVVAGSLVVLSVALAWRATVRLAEARGRARTLELEARHLHDLSQVAAGLAHETRNPLGLIRGWAQRWSQTGGDSREVRQQAQTVLEECDRVTARINQFLTFVRPNEPVIERVDAAAVVAELAVLLEPDLDARHVTLRRPVADGTVLADREMLRQALFNLLQNAVQASPSASAVETRLVRGRSGMLRIEVADRGPGVPREAVDKLFTPYFTTRADGTGLGLAIVRRIAAAHGWEAGYSPGPEGGAIFWLDGIHG